MTALESRHTGSLWRIAEIRAVFAISCAGLTSFSLTLTALPAWAAGAGHPESVVGTITGVMLAVTVLTQLGSARLMRRFSTRRLLVLGSVLLGLPTPLYLIGTELWWLYLLSAVRGVGFAIITVVAALAIPRAAPPQRRGEAIGIFGLSAAIPMMVATAGGAALTLNGSFPLVAALGAIPVATLLAAPWVNPTPLGSVDDTAIRPAGLVRLLLPSGVLFVVTVAGGGLVTILPLAGLGSAGAAAALVVYGAVGMLIRWRIGYLTDRIGHRVVYLVLLGVGVAGLALAAHGLLTQNAATLYVGAGAFGATFGGMQTVTLDLAFAAVEENSAPTASAVWNAGFDGGTAAGAAFLGFVAGTVWGGPGALALGGVAVAVMGVAGLVTIGPLRRPGGSGTLITTEGEDAQ
ncbi:MFS transporter [Ruania zhangjianzhongii]|uniref:MFS transporter n=1 Tax=Ruania zhangjianzhongii TaxID=2603206 RepID=UPI0011CA31EA|nr:MFS transporter [Ruania zhangjianzhongii]